MGALHFQIIGETANFAGLTGKSLPAAIEVPGSADLLPACPARVREVGQRELAAAERRIAELERELAAARDIASTDPLTGAPNRRGLDAAFEREQARARRSGAGMVLALIDLDNFKLLNDRYGHHAGDQALIQLVEFARLALRPSDVLARFGGEEFVLLFPDSSLVDAKTALERLQRVVAEQPLAACGATLTFSAGVVVPGNEESCAAAIQRADAATYAAKRAGKNCVMVG